MCYVDRTEPGSSYSLSRQPNHGWLADRPEYFPLNPFLFSLTLGIPENLFFTISGSAYPPLY
jgi:hypothetical protein